MLKRENRRDLLLNQPLEPRRYQGAFVYKYRKVEPLGWLKEIVLENKLYFPTPRQLDDPAEARPPLASASREALIEMLTQRNAAARPFLTNQGIAKYAEIDFAVRRFSTSRLLSMMKDLLYPLLEGVRIYSLSKRRDNLHLWKEYAGNHAGYCLEFRNEVQRNSDANVIFEPRLLTRLILGRKIAPTDAATTRAWAGDRKPPLTIVSE